MVRLAPPPRPAPFPRQEARPGRHDGVRVRRMLQVRQHRPPRRGRRRDVRHSRTRPRPAFLILPTRCRRGLRRGAGSDGGGVEGVQVSADVRLASSSLGHPRLRQAAPVPPRGHLRPGEGQGEMGPAGRAEAGRVGGRGRGGEGEEEGEEERGDQEAQPGEEGAEGTGRGHRPAGRVPRR